MAMFSRLANAFIPRPRPHYEFRPMRPDAVPDPLGLYDVLETYYHAQGLYEGLELHAARANIWIPGMRSLRNPAHRAVEFYVPVLFPDEEDLNDTSEEVRGAITQVMKWSNWSAKRRVAGRKQAMLGDVFIKVATDAPLSAGEDADPTRVIWQVIDPRHVPLFEVDERGFLTFIRIAIPVDERGADDAAVLQYDVEEWDKAAGTISRWRSDRMPRDIRRPRGSQVTVSGIEEETGVDFIPVGHGKFLDDGGLRGLGAFNHAVDKIDEANLIATRLHQILFRYNTTTWALESEAPGNGPGSLQLPPPMISTDDGRTFATDGTVTFGEETFVALPPGRKLQALVPQINYEPALSILNAHMQELEYDLPELAFYRMTEDGQAESGVKKRLDMSPALARAGEAQENASSLLVRCGEMAISIGQEAGIPEMIAVPGTYEGGDFEHSYRLREVIPSTPEEDAVEDRTRGEAITALVDAGFPRRWAMQRVYDLSDEELDKLMDAKAVEDEAAIERQQRIFNAGPGGSPFGGGGQQEDEDDGEV